MSTRRTVTYPDNRTQSETLDRPLRGSIFLPSNIFVFDFFFAMMYYARLFYILLYYKRVRRICSFRRMYAWLAHGKDILILYILIYLNSARRGSSGNILVYYILVFGKLLLLDGEVF